MSKVGVGLLLSAVLVLTPMWAAAAEFKVGVVDGMDVVSKSAAGKGVQNSIKHKSDELGKPFAQFVGFVLDGVLDSFSCGRLGDHVHTVHDADFELGGCRPHRRQNQNCA